MNNDTRIPKVAAKYFALWQKLTEGHPTGTARDSGIFSAHTVCVGIFSVLALFLVATSPTALAQNTVEIPNFGFESPVIPAGMFNPNANGAEWVLAGSSGLTGNGSGFTRTNSNAVQGNQCAYIQGRAGSVTQVLSSFTPGTTYTLSFAAAQRNTPANPGQTWDFRIDGVTVKSFDPGREKTGYSDYFASFTATSTTHTLGFYGTALHEGDGSVFIDNVHIRFGTGFLGEYFGNTNLTGVPVLKRKDGTIDFNWDGAQPAESVPATNFSVRWSGQIKALTTESYTFYTNSDDGARLWVNGIQLINNWTAHSPTENSGSIPLVAGQFYPIVLEYYQGSGGAVAQLSWSSPSVPKGIIPDSSVSLPPPGPVAPSALVATASSTTQINLVWSDNSLDETGFKIQRKSGLTGVYSQIGSVGPNETVYPDTSVSFGTVFYYRVIANNANGDSSFSNEASSTTLSPPPLTPPTPTDLVATAASNTQINLSWKDVSNNETGFKIERGTAIVAYKEIATSSAGATSYQDTTARSGTEYFYRIRATNAHGNSEYSGVASATTSNGGGKGTPPKPTNLVATIVSSTQIDLAWADNSLNENIFKIQRKTGVAGTWGQIGLAMVNQPIFQDTGLNPSTTYFYRVVSNNTTGDSLPTNEVMATTFETPLGPPYPDKLTIAAVYNTRIDITWRDNSSAELGFKVLRRGPLDDDYATVATLGRNTTSYQDTGLTTGLVYFYRVVAYDAAGDSGLSNEVSATTLASGFQNPGVYSKVVNGMLYEWIPTKDVNFDIKDDGKVTIIAPLTKPSSDSRNICNRWIYDHAHVRLSDADRAAIFGSGLALAPGSYGFAILWINTNSYDKILADPWTLTDNPDTYFTNSSKPDYFYLSIVPVNPAPPAVTSTPEVLIPYDLQRATWLPHYQALPYNLILPPDRGFGITRMLMDIPLSQIYQKVTQIQYVYSFLDLVPASKKWLVLRAYPGDTNEKLIQQAVLDKGFGYLSQMDEDFGNMGFSNHGDRAQEVLRGIFGRFQNQGVNSPNETRLYDDYFSDLEGYGVGESFRYNFNADFAIAGLGSQAASRKGGHGLTDTPADSGYFSRGAYNYRNWMQGGYLDSFAFTPEGLRIYNEIYNFERRFMAAPDRKVAKMGWTNAEGVNSTMFRAGTDWRLHFPTGDIIRSAEVAWPFHMMLNESFWTLLLANDYYLWHSSVPQVSTIVNFGDSWAAGAGKTRWQPTGGTIVDYNPTDPTQPRRTTNPLGMFPVNPHLGESGAFTGAWLVSQLTTASDRISETIEYVPFSYKLNGGPAQQGYYNSNYPTSGVLGTKLSRAGVANYGQANIVKSFVFSKPICVYTKGAGGAAVIYHNVHGGLTDVNDVTLMLPGGNRTFQVVGNCLHAFYLN